ADHHQVGCLRPLFYEVAHFVVSGLLPVVRLGLGLECIPHDFVVADRSTGERTGGEERCGLSGAAHSWRSTGEPNLRATDARLYDSADGIILIRAPRGRPARGL